MAQINVSYKQRPMGVFLFEFILPYFIAGFLIILLVYGIFIAGTFSGAFILPLVLTFWCVYTGEYPHFITQIITGLWNVTLKNDGIYGKKFWYRIFIGEKKFAEWNEIEEVRFIAGGLRKQNTNMGYLKFHKRDGTSFIICFFGVSPTNYNYFFSKHMGEDGYGYNLEMISIIAWKIGIDKLKDFPLLEGAPEVRYSRVKIIFAMEGIQRVVNLIKEGKCKSVQLEETKESPDAGNAGEI
ncbi:MAG: hypothetical protein HPY53_00320 [Brevinematales bacterium]|nr:hypothetical protein [Brevinematales bacterium]